MTEVGMALSNPLHGERRPGFVGLPMPGVQVRIVRPEVAEPPAADARPGDGSGPSASGEAAGELRVRGASLFSGYWRDAAATAAAFDEDGWFRTGDTAEVGGEPPRFRILGRTSVDILKVGGFKVSALEVEGALLACPGVAEAAVVGVPDAVYGQKIAALVVLQPPEASQAAAAAEEAALRASLAQLLAPYQLPQIFRFLPELPRNAMAKINKKALLARFFPPAAGEER
jgi:malonyl-CoA/methylmalonyl-CoA synthetase